MGNDNRVTAIRGPIANGKVHERGCSVNEYSCNCKIKKEKQLKAEKEARYGKSLR